jgi:membrane-associated phospholipid phosphatase
MFPIAGFNLTNYWEELTRLGESGFLLPLGLLLWFWLVFARCFRASFIWAAAFGFAVLAVVASKIAFLGWGIGIPSLNFTGFSGHTMLAAALFPALAYSMSKPEYPRLRAAAVLGAFVLAFLIAVSRVTLDAHSVSEVIAGFLLGAAAALALIGFAPLGGRAVLPVWVVLVAVALSGALSIGHRVPSHQIIVTMALKLSGHEHPYRRAPWLLHPDAPLALRDLEAVGVSALPAPGVNARTLDVVLGVPVQ